jgi:very-short-patch-repair endonuclease
MPVYRLADTLNVNSDRFDVIIIDEASQSGPEAMFLLEFANQTIIVGDDKQIKPDVFIDQDIVEKLRRLHIPDIPSSSVIGSVDTSFFEIGELLYGARVRLREHFRCMPEIIQFSNNLCYRSEPLIPLRQFGQQRLKPVVSAVHVKSGYQKGRTGRIVNPPEAEVLVDYLADCIKSKKYTKKSFGVISLLGDDQARLIEQMLLRRLGPEEMQRRRLVCGDAYAFQGDERDIMLLSMVSAPAAGVHVGTLSKQSDERRFNVAASRARDQMILFHTATLNDLSTTCMRHKLLEYCLNPKVDPLEVAGLRLDELRAIASSEIRRQGRPPHPFDSWFEVDVCIRVMERGYRIVPQYEVAGYFVDLMVEGMNGRIAVECDGDSWHGPDRFDQDMYRQRELVRAGLQFFRPRGSEFYRDPEACLANLWELLAESTRDATMPSADPRKTAHAEARNESAPEDGRSQNDFDESSQSKTSTEQPERRFTGPPRALELDLTAESGEGSSLPEYIEWPISSMPDPRTSSPDEIAHGFLEIIRVEGPMLWLRVYHRYARAAGIHRIGHQLRSTFNRAAARAIRGGALEQSTEDQVGQTYRTVWLRDTPRVVPRQRGPRTAEELPPSEITAVADQITEKTPMPTDQLIRRISEEFAIGRLTTSTRDILQKALGR